MSYDIPREGSVVLRLEFSIADAVHQRGLLSVLGAAISAWWNRPRLPANIPARLRADIGLSPVADAAHWLDIPSRSGIPDPLRRPGM
ncbi:hypothetical protein SAMN05428969_1241 [Devosia sp. YR412]|uniref:hypothetical protein n=1 Tax=Devosia sp. YR412 TaxID=1881030 RepID=UPI0008B7304D|nr:hypothetical protein [Devosia sp. YR412]SEP86207.1 hypothetical protein SAMN05428969_1241 [Devosia sp. YR412]